MGSTRSRISPSPGATSCAGSLAARSSMPTNRRRHAAGAMTDPGPSSSFHPAGLEVAVLRHGEAWDRLGANDDTIATAAAAAFVTAGADDAAAPCEVTVLLTDDREMRDL